MFPDKLFEILSERGKNTVWLAENTGISPALISSWKKNSNPKIDKIIIIAEFLNVSVDYLLEVQPREPDILTPEERILIEHFRRIEDDVGKEIVLEITKREASRYMPPGEGKSYNSRIG